MEFHIVVGGTSTAGLHSNTDSGHGVTSATTVTECSQGETVQVRAVNSGATRWGSYEGINVSVFSGTLLGLL